MHSRPNQLIRERAMKSSRSLIICLVLRVVPLLACVLAIDPMEWTYIKRANLELCGVNFYDFSDAFNCINSLHSLNICIINFLFNYLYENIQANVYECVCLVGHYLWFHHFGGINARICDVMVRFIAQNVVHQTRCVRCTPRINHDDHIV